MTIIGTGCFSDCFTIRDLRPVSYTHLEATREVFTEDGWLKTGDLGTIDANGFIYIRGRSKTMILSSNGQNIFPEEIESKLNNMPFVLESLIIERNKKLVALVYPDYESLDSLGLNTPEMCIRDSKNNDF